MDSILVKNYAFTISLFSLEKTLLQLSIHHTDGIYYGMLLRFNSAQNATDMFGSGETKSTLVYRTFESGIFHNFGAANGIDSMREQSSILHSDVLQWAVFTQWDIDAMKWRREKNLKVSRALTIFKTCSHTRLIIDMPNQQQDARSLVTCCDAV